jgi:molybdate transport system substrate-binding protein
MFLRNAPWIAFGCSVLALAVVLAVWFGVPTTPETTDPPDTGDDPAVIVLTAAALRPAMEPAAAEYEREYGVRIELRFNASENLLTSLKVAGQGDLFIPADDSYVAAARADNLVDVDYDLAGMTGAAVFRKDHPKAAEQLTWDDFLKARIAQANTESTAVGKITKQRLAEVGRWGPIEKARPTSMGTVTEAANAVHLGSADTAIVWDAIANSYKNLKVARLPGLERITARVTAAICAKARSREHARWFAQYLSDPKTGQKHFRAAGYAEPVRQARARTEGPAGDRELTLYAGAMLRPAIEETIQEFEAREGVRVTRVYNGCGILVTQMKAGKTPDLYLACDPRFMGDVASLFERPEVVSNNQLVIAVPKGNPAGLKELKDLGQPGLKVGVGHEQQCALGAITKETFLQSGVYAAVRKNIRVESPTGDLLVNQLLTEALDAVVCYVSNVVTNSDKIEGIPVTGIPCSTPEQPIAVARGSTNPALAEKLIEAIKSAESRKRFEQAGFGWGRRESKK